MKLIANFTTIAILCSTAFGLFSCQQTNHGQNNQDLDAWDNSGSEKASPSTKQQASADRILTCRSRGKAHNVHYYYEFRRRTGSQNPPPENETVTIPAMVLLWVKTMNSTGPENQRVAYDLAFQAQGNLELKNGAMTLPSGAVLNSREYHFRLTQEISDPGTNDFKDLYPYFDNFHSGDELIHIAKVESIGWRYLAPRILPGLQTGVDVECR